MLPRLPIFTTLIGAYAAVFRNFGSMLRATLVPILGVILLTIVRDVFPDIWPISFAFWLLELMLGALMAVACHRIILLGPDSLSSPWSVGWRERETSFFIWLIILGVFLLVAIYVISFVVFLSADKWIGLALTLMAATYLEGRFSMVLPATAVDRRMILSSSWYLTDGNGLRLMTILLVPLLVFGAAIQFAIGALSNQLSTVSTILVIVIAYLTVIVQIGVLSLSYRFLTDSAADGSAV